MIIGIAQVAVTFANDTCETDTWRSVQIATRDCNSCDGRGVTNESRARDFADLAGSADAGGLTGRNLIINGAMQVAQRGTSVTGVARG